eukprot:351257-Chlamydomonas_euryale.AAC.6
MDADAAFAMPKAAVHTAHRGGFQVALGVRVIRNTGPMCRCERIGRTLQDGEVLPCITHFTRNALTPAPYLRLQNVGPCTAPEAIEHC